MSYVELLYACDDVRFMRFIEGLVISESSKSVPELLLYHSAVPRL